MAKEDGKKRKKAHKLCEQEKADLKAEKKRKKRQRMDEEKVHVFDVFYHPFNHHCPRRPPLSLLRVS